MKRATLAQPGGLDKLQITEGPEPGEPGPGEIRVRVHASSLNFHDYGVVAGVIPTEDGRIPMADGAGVVEAVGPGVDEFRIGDHVVSTFFPKWLDGPAPIDNFTTTPGDGIDGYARERVTGPAQGFTRAPIIFANCRAKMETPPVPSVSMVSPAFNPASTTSARQAVSPAVVSVADSAWLRFSGAWVNPCAGPTTRSRA